MAKLQLTYFDIRGRAEPARLVLAMAGMAYDDTRIQFADWAKVKPTTPTGQLPFLKLKNGQILNQSNAIARYVAKLNKLDGKNAEEQAFVDEILDTVSDMFKTLFKCRFGDDASKAAAVEELNTKVGPEFVRKMEERASAGKKGILVGDSLTVADLAVYDMLENLTDLKADAIAKAPGLLELKNKVIGNKNVKEYLAKRAKTSF